VSRVSLPQYHSCVSLNHSLCCYHSSPSLGPYLGMSDYRLLFVQLLRCRQINPVLCLICLQQSYFHPCLYLPSSSSTDVAVLLRRTDVMLCEVILRQDRGNLLDEICLFYTGCPRRKGPNFGRVFLRSNYTDITQNTYIQS
jgi:hypothetical protein